MSASPEGSAVASSEGAYAFDNITLASRVLAWAMVGWTFAFVLNNYLMFWQDWPGIAATLDGKGSALGWLQMLIYVLAVVLPAVYVLRTKLCSLRDDSAKIYRITEYIIRAAFWIVLIVGVVDMIISFLRVEGFLEAIVGQELSTSLGKPSFRGPYVHVPLMALALVVAARTRTLGFIWLSLLVVVAELQIVITRFIFSYEQSFMGDIVRFWYAALFLFASAYTLIEEGHVRVDVLYAGMQAKSKGLVNIFGSLFMGASLCYVVLWLGMGNKSSVINAPLLSYEISQQGFGMYTKYLMAGFLAVFAISMMIQFAGYFLEGVADHRGDPGKRKIATDAGH